MNTRRGLLLMLIAASWIHLRPAPLPAQQPAQPPGDPDLWVNIGQDRILEYRVVESDTLPPLAFSAAYQFDMIYDSTCRVEYLFSECRRNRDRIRLQHWRRKSLVHMDADVMSYNSRTAVFPVNYGDTLSCYREWGWYNPTTNEQALHNYTALDTLAYTVELVRASDGVVLAVLDSLGIIPSSSGTPIIHGTRPIMARVSYIVPATMLGDSAFIGIRLYAHGSGPYHFIRYDATTVDVSGKLRDPRWIDYLRVYGFGLGVAKPAVDHLTGTGVGEGTLDIVTHGDRSTTIRFSIPKGGSSTVAVYDAAGQLMFYPYAGPAPEQPIALDYRFPHAGAYIITLMHDGRLVTSKNVTITK